MKTKRSTLIGLLSTLLVIVTVLSSVLVFTATADTTEPETSPDIYKYASSVAELKEKNELTDWYLDEDGWDVWYEVDPATNGRDTGYYFIDLTELDYDTVAFALASQNKNFLRYAFLTEMPENDGDVVKLAAGTEYNKMETSSSSWNKKLAGRLFFDDIPEDAKYLAVLGRYWSSDGYCPTSITFLRTDKNLLRNDLATYEYQINDILCASHVVDGGSWAVKDAGKVTGSGLIPIAGTTFDSVSFTPSFVGDTVEYNFLTGIPGNWGSLPTVDGSTGMKTAEAGEKIEIPAGAEYIVVNHTKQNTLKLPARITFFNSNATEDWLGIPAASTTKTVAYTGLEENGCVYGWDGKSGYSHIWVEKYSSDYVTGFIDLTDRNYTKVTFVSSGTYLGYAFLNETPVLGEKVSYAGGATKFTEPGVSAGKTVEVNIPADATTIVVWMREGSTSYVPSSISLTYEKKVAVPYSIELGAVAEARLNANSGLRFTTRIPTSELAGLDYTVGTLIFPTDYLGKGKLTVESEGALNIVMTRGVAGSEYTYFSATMTGILPQNYARRFTAVSYIEIDGKYYYTESATSSIYEAAVATYMKNAEDANADAVRAYIDAVVVIEDGAQVMPYDGYEHALRATVSGNTLTISAKDGSSLSADDLKTVILDGVIFTGGWKVSGKNLTATLPTSLDATATDEDQLNWALDDDTDLSFRHPEPEWDRWDNGADIMTATNSLLYLTYELRNCYNNSTYYDACLTRILEQLRYLIDEDNNATPFFDLKANWPYCNLTGAIALCKDTPAIWNSLTKDERARYDLIMECFAYILTLGTDDDNNYETGPLLDGNFKKSWNANYRLANVTPMLFIADYFGGADAVDALLLSFDYDSVIARMKAYGFERSYNAWTTEPASGKPTVKEIMMNGGKAYLTDGSSAGSGKGVRTTYTYNGYRLDQPDKILRSLFEHNYSGGAVKSSIKKYSFLGDNIAYIDGNLTSPYEGQKGMMLEFNSDDGGGIRSSAEYCMHDFIMVVAILMVTEELDIYDPTDAANLDVFRLVWIGNQDFMYKYEMGYMSYSNGESEGVIKESTKKGYMLMKAWWNDRYGDPTYTISFPYGS